MMELKLIEQIKDLYREIDDVAKLRPFYRINDIKIEFALEKSLFSKPETEGTRLEKIEGTHESLPSFKLLIHESYINISSLLIEREVIRSYVHPGFANHVITSYFIHNCISSSEYLWAKIGQDLTDSIIDLITKSSNLKFDFIRKPLSISLGKIKILNLLRQLRVDSTDSLLKLLFWQFALVETGLNKLSFEESVGLKQLLSTLNTETVMNSAKQIREEAVNSQTLVEIAKMKLDGAISEAAEKLGIRRTMIMNWAILDMKKYVCVLEFNQKLMQNSPMAIWDLFLSPLRLISATIILDNSICITYADYIEKQSSYQQYFHTLWENNILTRYQLFNLDSVETILNLNYFNHDNIDYRIITEDLTKTQPFMRAYSGYIKSIKRKSSTKVTKAKEIENLFQYLTHKQEQKDTHYTTIAFRKFVESLEPIDIDLLLTCSFPGGIRLFSMVPIDKSSVESINSLVKEDMRLIKRLNESLPKIQEFSEKYSSLSQSIVHVASLLSGIIDLKTLCEKFLTDELQISGKAASIQYLVDYTEKNWSNSFLFSKLSPDVYEDIIKMAFQSITGKKAKIDSATIFKNEFNNQIGPLIKILTALQRLGITFISDNLEKELRTYFEYLEKVSTSIKGFLTLSREDYEIRLKELIQYAGEMDAIDVNIPRSILFSTDVVHLIVETEADDPRIKFLEETFEYTIICLLSTEFDSDSTGVRLTKPKPIKQFRIKLHPSLLSEFRSLIYSIFSKEELILFTEPSCPDQIYSISISNLHLKQSNQELEFKNLEKFAESQRKNFNLTGKRKLYDMSASHKKAIDGLKATIKANSTQNTKNLTNEITGLIRGNYLIKEKFDDFPVDLIQFLRDQTSNVVTPLDRCLQSIDFRINPETINLEKIILIVRSDEIDLYPDRISKTDLGILFSPGLHSLFYSTQSNENMLIVEYYLPRSYFDSSTGFKRITQVLEAYPVISFDVFSVRGEGIYYNFDLFIGGRWLNLDYVIDSKFELSDRDFEHMQSHVVEVEYTPDENHTLSHDQLLQLTEFQSKTDASKLKSLDRLTALEPYSGNIDLKFAPSQFDFQFLFSVLVLCEDKQILKKIKIIFSTLPKTIQMAVSTVNRSDANKPLGSGLLVYVNCGMHSVRHTINKIYMGLHEMGADHIEIITGLSELNPADPSIQYFKNLSWTAWFSPEGKLIPFFPLCGRYGFNFNCDDLYTMYKVALKRNFFGSPDFEKRVRVMRFATTEIKKSKKKFTRDALQTRMLEIESEALNDTQDDDDE